MYKINKLVIFIILLVVLFLSSGILACLTNNKAILFHHDIVNRIVLGVYIDF